eukprot:8562167-Pyramimonas_sp.AAC.1
MVANSAVGDMFSTEANRSAAKSLKRGRRNQDQPRVVPRHVTDGLAADMALYHIQHDAKKCGAPAGSAGKEKSKEGVVRRPTRNRQGEGPSPSQ